MRELLRNTLVAIFFVSALSINAQSSELPSESYYKENIAVNDINAGSSVLKHNSNDEGLDPGGTDSGNNVPPVGGGELDTPVGDAFYPLAVALLSYMGFIAYRKRVQKAKN